MITKFKLYESNKNIITDIEILDKISRYNKRYKDIISKNKYIDVDAMDKTKQTILNHAIDDQDEFMIKYLIKHGADVNHVDGFHYSILIYAASLYVVHINKFKLIDIIINAGADWNYVDSDGYDFFHYLNTDESNYIKNKFPEKYHEYLRKKEMIKFNI